MTSLHRAALIIHYKSCRDSAYDTAWPALLYHDGIRYFGARKCEAPPVHSLPTIRMALPSATREDLARSRTATITTKSP